MAPEGTVKWLSDETGYGFISRGDGSEDLYVQYSGIQGSGFKSLEGGTRVTYETNPGQEGDAGGQRHARLTLRFREARIPARSG